MAPKLPAKDALQQKQEVTPAQLSHPASQLDAYPLAASSSLTQGSFLKVTMEKSEKTERRGKSEEGNSSNLFHMLLVRKHGWNRLRDSRKLQ